MTTLYNSTYSGKKTFKIETLKTINVCKFVRGQNDAGFCNFNNEVDCKF